ncbi:hypothetical protein L6R50_25295 [Myxococcota bacterium]|nr:hypothetical protein [Myxococcota bacterium]
MRPTTLLAPLALLACGCSPEATFEGDRVFVAVEEDGVIAAVDAGSGELLSAIDLSDGAGGGASAYHVHNVQGSADAATVWATAMPASHDHGDGEGDAMPEELIGVDTRTHQVRARIPLGEGIHAAHVVLHGDTAYVTANETDAVLEVDLQAEEVARTIPLPAGSGPHGARLTGDGGTLVVAGMGAGSIEVVDLATGGVESYPLPGRGVQAAVLPGDGAAWVTVFDTVQVARLDLVTRELTLFDLPEDSAGPVQVYPTPDGAHLWVADQGVLDGRPVGDRLLRVDAATGEVDLVAQVGGGPHGVVVEPDGATVWTTLLVDGTLQSVDAQTGEVLTTTQVGEAPNGVTCVHEGGSTP